MRIAMKMDLTRVSHSPESCISIPHMKRPTTVEVKRTVNAVGRSHLKTQTGAKTDRSRILALVMMIQRMETGREELSCFALWKCDVVFDPYKHIGSPLLAVGLWESETQSPWSHLQFWRESIGVASCSGLPSRGVRGRWRASPRSLWIEAQHLVL